MSGKAPNSNAGHRERLRRRFLGNGLGALHDHEALELVLAYAIPQRDVKPLAKLLIATFGSFEAVFDATEHELVGVPGIGEYSAAHILLIKAVCARYLEQKARKLPVIRGFDETVNFVRMKLGGGGKETLMVIFLDSQKQILHYHLVAGTVDRAAVFRREVMELCFRYKATAIILAHNHPSGVCVPSAEDIAITRRITEAARANDIEVVDHLIVTPHSCRSLKQDKLI